MREIILCHPVRTVIGAYGGGYKGVSATDLGATVIRETLRRAGLDGGRLGSVTMGDVVQAGMALAESTVVPVLSHAGV